MNKLVPKIIPEELELALVHAKEAVKRPLSIVPQAVRPYVFRLWMCHRHLSGLETELPITGPLAVWIQRYCLTHQDAVEILESMLAPDVVAGFKFASDLTTLLAQRVAERLKHRKAERETAERRREAELARSQAVECPATIRDLIASTARGFAIRSTKNPATQTSKRTNDAFVEAAREATE